MDWKLAISRYKLLYVEQVNSKVLLNSIGNYIKYSVISHDESEKAMAPHSSTLAWKIPWMEEPGRLQSMGSLRVGHD